MDEYITRILEKHYDAARGEVSSQKPTIEFGAHD